MSFPRLQAFEDKATSAEIELRRQMFAKKMAERQGATVPIVQSLELPLEEHAERLARSLVADFGPRWSDAVQLILRAGMRIERGVLDRREREQVARDAAERDAKGETE